MYMKLALNNVRRNFKDYGIYFITVSLTISLLFSFSSIIYSPSIQSLYTYIEILQDLIIPSTIIVTAVSGLLIGYITRFLIRKRSREFAVCFVMGMERSQILHIFMLEHLIMGLISLIIGIFGGMFLFQILSIVIFRLFNEVYLLHLDIPPNALLQTLFCFSLIFLYSLWRNSRFLRKIKLVNLLLLSRKNEKQLLKNPFLSGSLLIFSLILSLWSYFLLKSGLLMVNQYQEIVNWMNVYQGAIIGVFSILLIGLSFPAFWKSVKEWRLTKFTKGKNLFLIRQTCSKITSTGLLLGVVSLMITFSLVCFSGAVLYLPFNQFESGQYNKIDFWVSSYDLSLDFTPLVNLISENATIETITEFQMYYEESEDIARILISAGTYEGTLGRGEIFLSISDYRKLFPQKAVPNLKDSEYAICINETIDTTKFEEILNQNGKISIASDILYPASAQNGIWLNEDSLFRFIFILPDQTAEKLLPEKYLSIKTREGVSVDLYNQVQDLYPETATLMQINGQSLMIYRSSLSDIICREARQASQKSTLLSIIFPLLYLGLVFSFIAATLLSVKQLSASEESCTRFTLLRRLGMEERDISILAIKEILLYFLFPLIPGIYFSILIYDCFWNGFCFLFPYQFNPVWPYLIMLLIFLTVYSCYFAITYAGFKRNISSTH